MIKIFFKQLIFSCEYTNIHMNDLQYDISYIDDLSIIKKHQRSTKRQIKINLKIENGQYMAAIPFWIQLSENAFDIMAI